MSSEASLHELELPLLVTPINLSQKRWSKAFSTIKYSRAFSSLLDLPTTILAKPNQKRWRKAFTVICCSRAFSNPFKKLKKKSPVSSNQVVIDILEPHPSFPKIDPSVLMGMVKQKNLDQLGDYDGVEGLACGLKTNLENGISGDTEDVSRRTEAFGSNTCKRLPGKSFFYFVWEALRDPLGFIVTLLTVLSFGLQFMDNASRDGLYWQHYGGSIFVAVLARIAFPAISNYRKSRQFLKSLGEIDIQVDVVRSGIQLRVSMADIVFGDVVCLSSGDQVPADGLFIDGHSLHVDESSITGESEFVEVGLEQNPFLSSGTKVADGEGRMLVTSVGMNTTWGHITSTISVDMEYSNEKTPLTSRLKKLTSSLQKAGTISAVIVLVALLIRYFTGNMKDENGKTEYNGAKTKINMIIISVTAVVASAMNIVDLAIPEKLPWAVTLTLAYWRWLMERDHNILIQNLSGCQNIGSVTTICTDKTGMLTLSPVKVPEFWIGQELVDENSFSSRASTVVELLQQCVGLSTNGWDCETVSKLRLEMEGLEKSCEIVQVEAFNSTRKISGTLMREKGESTRNVHWKGAAKMVLGKCSSYYDVSGNIKVLDDLERKKFDKIIQAMAACSLHCIGFAHRQVQEQQSEEGKAHVEENNLTLLGLVGLKDLCCPGAKKAVEECQYAGVNVKLITSDNLFTARAIATECGILKPNQDMSGAVVEGLEFRNYTPEERMENVDKICVMARSSPFDKLLMVKCLREKGHVVAVTGDGTNDAPTLKEADIGLSMGIQVTEVAKKNFDIVILDENFKSMATVLRSGRCVYNNIQKFIQFQLTVNFAALGISIVGAIFIDGVPLFVLHLFWLNLVMDTLGALALATGKPTKELMEKPPVGPTEPVMTNVMRRNLLGQAIYQIAVMLTLQFKGEAIFNVTTDVNQTLMFNVFVLCQVFDIFNARELKKKNIFEGIQRNTMFLGIVVVMVMLQVVIIEFLKKIADTERLTWSQWGVCVGFASVSWPIGWLVKWIPVPEKPFLLPFLLGGEGIATPESDEAPTTNSGDEVPPLPESSLSLTPSESSPASPTNSGIELPQLSKTFSLRHRKKESDSSSATNSDDEARDLREIKEE